MTATDPLLLRLADDATPVRRLAPPARRAFAYIVFAATLLIPLLLLHGARGDIAEAITEPEFALRLIAAGATGAAAAFAACMLAVPGRAAAWALLPLPPFALWAGTIGFGCLTGWISLDLNGVTREELLRCASTLLIAGVPLTFAMLGLLRRAAPLRPRLASLTGGLAAAGMTAFALTLLHPIDASIAILVWNGGSVLLFVGVELALARRPRHG